ncbi:MAG: SAV_915 family protein [Rhodococcus sp. (in: high G+C Gram-positive bacteria)]|nr:SAV_915 family protein [Rhodococcus sp. (in: high G+C Gram-positive bacteria)]
MPLQPSSSTAIRTVDLRILLDGRVGLAAYTSLTSLVQNCGDGQPWGLVDERGLAEIRASAEIDVVLLDAALPVPDRRIRADGSTPDTYMTDPLR